MKEEFDFPIIPAITPPKQHNTVPAPEPTEKRGSRMLCDFDYQLIEQIKDYAYGQGLTQQQVVREAVALFLKDKPIESRPEALKNRPRPGRKPKNV